MRAVLYHRRAPGDLDDSPEPGLERLRQDAAERGWEVADEYSDAAPRGAVPWPGRQRLKAEVLPGDVILVESLHRLARSLEDLVDTVGHFLDRGAHVVTLEAGTAPRVDTTTIIDRVALHDAIALLRAFRHGALGESQRSRHVRPRGPRPGRPAVAVNPQEVADLYHAGKSEREAVRELARRGAPVSRTKLRQVLAHLQAQDRLDAPRRHQAIEARGGLRPGGRPRKPRKVD
jgi:DNA invertase Pin-like site-specific DNA recombinase